MTKTNNRIKGNLSVDQLKNGIKIAEHEIKQWNKFLKTANKALKEATKK